MEHISSHDDDKDGKEVIENIKNDIAEEIKFLLPRKKIISILMMESLKNNDRNNYLFKCGEMVIKNEADIEINSAEEEQDENKMNEKKKLFAFEFFTGFIPIISFVAFQEKWCSYFKYDKDQLLDYFIDSFTNTHLNACMSVGQTMESHHNKITGNIKK